MNYVREKLTFSLLQDTLTLIFVYLFVIWGVLPFWFLYRVWLLWDRPADRPPAEISWGAHMDFVLQDVQVSVLGPMWSMPEPCCIIREG